MGLQAKCGPFACRKELKWCKVSQRVEQNAEPRRLVTEFEKKRGVGKTECIKRAVVDEYIHRESLSSARPEQAQERKYARYAMYAPASATGMSTAFKPRPLLGEVRVGRGLLSRRTRSADRQTKEKLNNVSATTARTYNFKRTQTVLLRCWGWTVLLLAWWSLRWRRLRGRRCQCTGPSAWLAPRRCGQYPQMLLLRRACL